MRWNPRRRRSMKILCRAASKRRPGTAASLVLLAGAVWPLLHSTPCIAQTSSRRALAEALFRQGRDLMSQRRYEEACPKFAESQRLDPGGGTLLNLAVCHENQGRLASAWAEFQEALAQAKDDGRLDRVSLAEERIAALEPQLARLTVTVADTSPPGLVVTVNGTRLGSPAWGAKMPVDAGTVRVEARAPGREPFVKSVEARDGDSLSIEIPELGELPEPAIGSSGVTDQGPKTRGAPDHSAAYVVGAVGLAALVTGGYFGVRALKEKDRADRTCDDSYCTSEAGRQADESAVFNGWLSTIGVGVGLAAVTTAVYLYVSEENASEVALAPAVGKRGAGVALIWRH
jgi:hypothetical protein